MKAVYPLSMSLSNGIASGNAPAMGVPLAFSYLYRVDYIRTGSGVTVIGAESIT